MTRVFFHVLMLIAVIVMKVMAITSEEIDNTADLS